ncbi:hypothetical protein [Leptospira kirschneri]|uniref:Uncharacterized protein n=1 Tax=Leptospira kirschneri str. 200802841 TaxID=1193047 RepID=A0A828Y1B7_9LEPT|nr:hypothetical protein [Leptospira kirschneri]EMO75530.1 hypothetical protein LEP1GSC127_1919 [Leptospira kirschneri str. 200801925]EJO69536.1 hypothetical protein LEP1GSC044_3499 [Leptospira kirschneri serovar Grippotyphosa str. RM52]EKO49904.1 hypothetical protein LEP1GSC131_3671 [Leptospira kirschneri str. 200802841]EKQ85197.1 hypothetical protein LEP1GSC064_1652 [Leptospira kirschneri serovar Grippotyphosa str. Moskva]EKR06654.1 hypothetical protein LEP1GSC122_0926 [Leptospira kirschneri 
MKRLSILGIVAVLALYCSASQKIYLLSYGDWKGKKLPGVEKIKGEIKQGEDCGFRFSLSKALENALLKSKYDTILDAEVTHSASMLAPFNCIAVKGFAFDSSEVQKEDKK